MTANVFLVDQIMSLSKLVKIDNTLRVVLICDVENPYSLFYPHKLFFD